MLVIQEKMRKFAHTKMEKKLKLRDNQLWQTK